ncbi:MAG: zinc ribbon domain-containing protein [Thermoplasmatales archaeon]|nr:zinc ribbon domain-containing protein [Thermoplasmatales archaeon]
MKFCPYCGTENQDDFRFCVKCHKELPAPAGVQQVPQPPPSAQPAPQPQYAPPPQQPSYPQPTPPPTYQPPTPSYPPKPKRRTGLIIVVVAVVAIIIIGVVLWAFVFKEKEEAKTMTYGELWSDVEFPDGGVSVNMTLKSYKDGDVLYIKDKVFCTEYYPNATPQAITLIYLQSGGWLPICLLGDKRAEYPNGSTVTIPVHVKQYIIEGNSVLWLEEWYNYYETGVYTMSSGGVVQWIYLDYWSNVTGGASATVCATSPSMGIDWGDITWQLYDVTDGAVETTATWTHTDVDADGYVEAGDTIKVTFAGGGHDYKVRAIIDGSIRYESVAFII